MNLFNRKTLERFVKPAPLPPAHFALLQSWADMIGSGRVYGLKEVALHGEFTETIIKGVLGYLGPSGGAEYTVATEQAILQGSVDLALGRFGGGKPEILAPLELKGAKTKDLDAIMPGRNKTPIQQAWEYAMNARGVKWVLVSNMIELRLYGFGEGTNAYETFQLDRLTDPNEYARFMLLLSADSLLSGRTLDLLKQSRAEDKDITDKLYEDYKDLRLKLIRAVREAEPTIAALDTIAIAQKILDRVLFIAFAEDTDLLPENTLSQAFVTRDPYNPRPVWNNFLGLFNAIDKGSDALKIPRYNGGLFHQDDAINSLVLQDEVCEAFKALGEYDFASEVSVTVLGHIFEQSIADVERLQAQARGEETEETKATGTTGRRKRDGVVYTPDYIARFIVAETLGAHLKEAFTEILRTHAKAGADLSDYAAIEWRRRSAELEAWQAYRHRLKTLRIVDPACGSGVFLIMAFDFLKAELGRVNDKIAVMEGRIGQYGTSDTQDLFDPDSEILTNNLFGVDVNSESIEIAKLSLWIKTARRGKVLDSLSSNLRVGDSLIEDSNFAYLDHAFTWADAFPNIFAEGGFDVVLGNPPYVRMEHLKALKPYLEKRYEVVSERADLYCYFFERGLRLLKPGGRLGFISSNTFFKTGSGKPLRGYLLREATVECVVDFGDLQIFEGVTTYPAILTMKRGVAPTGHKLRFWKVDTLPETNFQAAWENISAPYPQAALGAGSWEFENDALRALRDKLINGRSTLEDVYGPPLMGVKTGLKSAFVITTEVKEFIARDPQSVSLLKPLIEGKDLQRWHGDHQGRWLIYIPKNRVDIEQYPGVRDWLAPMREKLENRATQQEWFELQQAQEAYAPHFEGPKIMWSDVASEARCHLDLSGTFGENTCYFLSCAEYSVAAYLNSKLAWFVIKALTPKAQGGYARFQAQFVKQLPLTSAIVGNQNLDENAKLCHRLAADRLRLQRALTRRIPDICPPGRDLKLTTRLREWWTMADFAAFRAELKKAFKADIPLIERSDWEDWFTRDRAEIASLSAEITKTEAQIDRIIYGLFELTPEEIVLLEGAV